MPYGAQGKDVTTQKDGGSAFPFEQITVREAGAPSKWINHSGMSLRQYAAIKLLVPDSGTDWLDDMIRQSLRTNLATKAMSEVWRDIPEDANRAQALLSLGRCAYEMADAMLAAREAS